MEPKRRDEVKYRISAMKSCAAQLFATIFYNKLSIDYRVVHRFRIWQQIFLNNVMQGIESKHLNRQLKLKRTILVLMSTIVAKHKQKAFHKWMKKTKLACMNCISDNHLKAALNISAILLRLENSNVCERLFPIFYANSLNWCVSKRKLAFSMWKKNIVKSLLCENRRENAVIRLFYALGKKVNPIISHSLKQMQIRGGNSLGTLMLVLTMRRILQANLYTGFLSLKKIRPFMQVKNWNSKEKQVKLSSLQRVATFDRLNRLVTKKSEINSEFLQLFMCFMIWKKSFSHTSLENSMQLYMLAPNQRLKEISVIFLNAVYSHQKRIKILRKFSNWKNKSNKQVIKKPQWSIDKYIIENQAKVAASIETQIITRGNDIAKLKQKQKIKTLSFIFRKSLKMHIQIWRSRIKDVKEKNGISDPLFDYIRYLEDKLGLSSKVPYLLGLLNQNKRSSKFPAT
ncbi:unnamed protein product [Blepharisma stoltei]|uniref:Uncharacterized protein n=1 Tax=Blepharisma stoltei TaxID=1481888 RepID=A0AAU9II21_9CILI|nr:unnamed protein product [Blepharisma stoltei]